MGIIFVGPKTDEYKVSFVNLGWASMNIWAVQFDFDQPHIFIGLTMSPTNVPHIDLLPPANGCHATGM
jgi:hypothetical protein